MAWRWKWKEGGEGVVEEREGRREGERRGREGAEGRKGGGR